jgi:uncharacterized protein (TIGR02996 family)
MAAYADLLRAVLAEPEDDAPRLIYADWLDEEGEGDRAEFIRVQCALARRNPRYCRQSTCNQAGHGPCSYCRDTDDLRSREQELWGSWPHADDVRSQIHPTLPVGWAWTILPEWMGGALVPPCAVVRRGFVARVRCRLEDWIGEGCKVCLGNGYTYPHIIGVGGKPGPREDCPHCDATGRIDAHGPAIVAAHPVERVEVTDREPIRIAGLWYWYQNESSFSPHHLPQTVCRSMSPPPAGVLIPYAQYPTRDAALDALSAALLSLARGVHPGGSEE